MPSLTVHLAIAKKYLENHQEDNEDRFINGSIAPDFGYDKISNHYGKEYDKINCLEDYICSLVNYEEYLFFNRLDLSYNRGFFLHLLTDYMFYYDFLTKNDIKGLSLNEIIKIGYKDFDSINSYLIEKYDLKIPGIVENITKYSDEKLNILKIEDIDNFIEVMANTDLNNYKSRIRLKK